MTYTGDREIVVVSGRVGMYAVYRMKTAHRQISRRYIKIIPSCRHTLRMFLSSFSQAVLHRENLKILILSECNDLPNHPRNQKRNQNLFWWEHKAICRNQDATCLPSELRNLCKRNNYMLLIVYYNWVQRMRMLLKLGTRKRWTGPRNG